MQPANSPQIYWVLGMHRSGTSLVSGLLHQSGIAMGTDKSFKPRPNQENPKGFFENYDFRRLNDQILESAGYTVKDWNPKLKPLKISWWQRMRMKELVHANDREYHSWGWKDPRQMLTCSQWFEVMTNANADSRLKIIFVYRNPLNVSISMLKRKNIGTISHGLALWFLYNKKSLNFIEETKIPCFTFSFERLITEPSYLLPSLSQFTGIQIKPEIYDEFFSPTLVRSDFQKSKEIKVNRIEDNKIAELFEQLVSWESHPIVN